MQEISGKTFLAILLGSVLLGALVLVGLPFYHQALGREAHYSVLWCTKTGPVGGTSPEEIRAQGFGAVNRMVPGSSHLASEPGYLVQCFSKDYGQERPNYRNMDRMWEYRVVSTYFADPDQAASR